MKKPDEFELEVQAIQCTLEALDVVRESFVERSNSTGLTKQEFSKWIGKDPSYVSRILNGRVSNVNYKTISRMLVALGYYPELNVTDCENLHILPNYVHSDIVEDVYVRSSTENWHISREERDGFVVSKPREFRKEVASNG